MTEMYLSPSSIIGFSVEEFTQRFSGTDQIKRLIIITNITKTSYGGNVKNHSFEFNYNISKDGFKVNKEINHIVERLKLVIKSPLTCGFLIKISCENSHSNEYKIDFE